MDYSKDLPTPLECGEVAKELTPKLNKAVNILGILGTLIVLITTMTDYAYPLGIIVIFAALAVSIYMSYLQILKVNSTIRINRFQFTFTTIVHTIAITTLTCISITVLVSINDTTLINAFIMMCILLGTLALVNRNRLGYIRKYIAKQG